MSLEMHVFLEKSRIPSRADWQNAVTSLNLPLLLDTELNIQTSAGFSPMKIKGIDSGFEIYSEPAEQILQTYPQVKKSVDRRDWCISFRSGGDSNECACVLAAGAGLVQLCGAVAFYPDDNLVYDLEMLLEETKLLLT